MYSVSRVHETVYLRVGSLEHLTPYWVHNILPVVVNVVYSLKQRVLQAQHTALLSVRRSLEQLQRRKDWSAGANTGG